MRVYPIYANKTTYVRSPFFFTWDHAFQFNSSFLETQDFATYASIQDNSSDMILAIQKKKQYIFVRLLKNQ